ncbi:hypothetical protein J0K78_05020 [Halobacillus sp. GSS1]|uniref:hypothetical protein n=1 Tax=Halobacillus sp. GSS1 TaxID=2815919 RepID=UPI001A8F1C86|nr:hypothetical protein [Halobacillus sp. GSS1]MBN9653622.1 hypothetical protein [Halobacillus sp. GSS1]
MKQSNITVIDSIMGSGKTSWALQHMNRTHQDTNFIYITPFLKEVDRIKENVPNRNFHSPENKGEGKLANLKQLITNEKDIAATHKLFQNVDDEIHDLLKATNYTLILDEAMDVVERYDMNNDDFKLLIDSGMVSVEKDNGGLVKWNDESEYQETEYDKVKNLAKTENLYFFDDTILFWTFPISVFSHFKDVYIMTYLFKAQQQRYYYDMYDIQYIYKGVQFINNEYVLEEHSAYKAKEKEFIRKKIKPLINIYDGKLNNIGENEYDLSFSWFRKKPNSLKERMRRNLHTYFKRHAKTATSVNMWTSYKDDRPKLKGKCYAGLAKDYKDVTDVNKIRKICFVPHNTRATNNFAHKESLAYVINRFMNPYEKRFFTSRGVEVEEDLYALSELIQWIWRSRIRNGESINLYIPSKRMRRLFEEYLEGVH